MDLNNERLLEMVSVKFKMLSEPTRLKILCSLKTGEKSVTEIIETTNLQQANVSKNLKMLLASDMVAKRKERNQVFYRILDASIFQMCEVVCNFCETNLNHKKEIFENLN